MEVIIFFPISGMAIAIIAFLGMSIVYAIFKSANDAIPGVEQFLNTKCDTMYYITFGVVLGIVLFFLIITAARKKKDNDTEKSGVGGFLLVSIPLVLNISLIFFLIEIVLVDCWGSLIKSFAEVPIITFLVIIPGLFLFALKLIAAVLIVAFPWIFMGSSFKSVAVASILSTVLTMVALIVADRTVLGLEFAKIGFLSNSFGF